MPISGDWTRSSLFARALSTLGFTPKETFVLQVHVVGEPVYIMNTYLYDEKTQRLTTLAVMTLTPDREDYVAYYSRRLKDPNVVYVRSQGTS
mmetsp:Transcript_32095/g.51421  ORF Transcript_32095/g.51421 Transcript_32095/m.51421 type:complete len:92 (+) Transcript_32095:1493-1768(+)